jgi:mono/diheme cytochrome c family protein
MGCGMRKNPTIRGTARLGAALALCLLATTPSLAADAEHGGVIARRWCASCHGLAPGERRGDRDAPDFAAIARDPAMDGRGLATFLAKPHGKMPDLSLSRAEIDDLVAYVRAQAR